MLDPSTRACIPIRASYMIVLAPSVSCHIVHRLPVGQFVSKAFDIIRQWSKRRDPPSVNCVHFSGERTIPLRTWTEAYQWALGNHKVLQRADSDGFTEYLLRKFNENGDASLLKNVEEMEVLAREVAIVRCIPKRTLQHMGRAHQEECTQRIVVYLSNLLETTSMQTLPWIADQRKVCFGTSGSSKRATGPKKKKG